VTIPAVATAALISLLASDVATPRDPDFAAGAIVKAAPGKFGKSFFPTPSMATTDRA
jgi:hypothetical protein